MSPAAAPDLAHPRLQALIDCACAQAGSQPMALGIVHPCDALALQAARAIADAGIARPVLIGPRAAIQAAAQSAAIDIDRLEILEVSPSSTAMAPDAGTAKNPDAGGAASARHATALVRDGAIAGLMKGSLHTDELMAAIVDKATGLRGPRRISHAFLFDLPRYHKLLALADCVVNINPNLATKRDIVGNAVALLQRLGIAQPKVAIVAAVETVNPAIPATLDAQALVAMANDGAWPGAIVEGPFGFDNAFSAEAARTKKMVSAVAGDADLMLMPDLNAGNMLYKSFNYVGGGDCAGLVLGAKVPVVLTSRADSLTARLASAALAVLATAAA